MQSLTTQHRWTFHLFQQQPSAQRPWPVSTTHESASTAPTHRTGQRSLGNPVESTWAPSPHSMHHYHTSAIAKVIAQRYSPEDRQIIRMRCRSKLAHRFRKRWMRLATQSFRKIQSGIDHVVAGPEHQRTYPGHGSNLFDVLNAFNRLDLRDYADVVVACGDVVAVIGIE